MSAQASKKSDTAAELKDLRKKLEKKDEEIKKWKEKALKEEKLRVEAERESAQVKTIVQQLMRASKQATPSSPSKGLSTSKPASASAAAAAATTEPKAEEAAAAAIQEIPEETDGKITRDEVAAMLRSASLSGNIDELDKAVQLAEAMGLTAEAGIGRRKLAKLRGTA